MIPVRGCELDLLLIVRRCPHRASKHQSRISRNRNMRRRSRERGRSHQARKRDQLRINSGPWCGTNLNRQYDNWAPVMTTRDQRTILRNASQMRLPGCLAVVLCLFVTGGLKAQTPDPTPHAAPQAGVRPPLSPFPRFEDWGFLRDPSLRVDPYDRLKFIPLNDSGTNHLTFGLENRTEFQYLNNNDWGGGPQNLTGYVLERLMPDIELRLGDHARVFATLTFDEFTGKYPRPEIDKDIADGHEGFVEFGSNLHHPHPGWDVIVGRQEIMVGTGRLLDDNEGVNVRSAFDGIRVGYDKPTGRIDRATRTVLIDLPFRYPPKV